MCYVCCPKFKITVESTKGKSGWQVIVETYEDGIQKDITFLWNVDGQELKTVEAGKKPFQPAMPGVVIIKVPFSQKDQTFSAHLIGADADISNRVLPGIRRPAFVPVKPKKGAGFLANLLGAGKGVKP